MSTLVANCPACGAQIQFKSGQSIVVICEYCHSAVARTDRDLKDLGKVAELVETGSPLDVGVRGTWKDVNFELTGRAQLGHEMGGQWDEWYATFSNGWLGWLAEAQVGLQTANSDVDSPEHASGSWWNWQRLRC